MNTISKMVQGMFKLAFLSDLCWTTAAFACIFCGHLSWPVDNPYKPLSSADIAPEPPDGRVDTWDLAVLADTWLEDTRRPPAE